MKKQPLKNIEVAVRMRPLLKVYEDEESWQVDTTRQKITSLPRSTKPIETSNVYEFTADHIFDQAATNENIYHQCCSKLIEDLFNSYNGTVFMYGQTTSGKTYTMLGSNKVQGIIVHSLMDVFQRIEKNNKAKNKECLSVSISYLEIYNEQINDLLNPSSVNLKIIDGRVPNLTQYPTATYKEALKMLEEGQQQRSYKEKNYHDHSSRSHTIFQIKILCDDKENHNGKIITKSVLNLVDLAGSQRTQDEILCNQQTAYINKSLFVLSNVIHRLAKSKNQGHIPFRDSKLTRLLAASLIGNFRTIIICTISPASLNFNQTLSTLRFANNSRKIQFKSQGQSLNQSSIMTKKTSKDQHKIISDLKSQNYQLKKNISILKQTSHRKEDHFLDEQMKIIENIAHQNNKIPYNNWQSKAKTLCDQYRKNIALINAASVQFGIDKQLINEKVKENEFQYLATPLFSQEI